jgi:hypothetical protein
MCSSCSSQWVTGREVIGELEEVAAVEVEGVVARGAPEGGPGEVDEVVTRGRSRRG